MLPQGCRTTKKDNSHNNKQQQQRQRPTTHRAVLSWPLTFW
jgi:hypothetical protein